MNFEIVLMPAMIVIGAELRTAWKNNECIVPELRSRVKNVIDAPLKLLILMLSVSVSRVADASIKNIIFDFGGVILANVPAYLAQNISLGHGNPVLIDAMESDHWKDWDRGLITKQELITRLLGLKFDKNAVELLLSETLSPQRRFIDETVAIIAQLKRAGYHLYILSNLPTDAYRVFIEGNTFFKQFEGMLFSYQVKCVKPAHGIYSLLLKKYALQAQESLFIDDKRENVNSAQELGLYGIVYNSGKLEADLKKLGINLRNECDTSDRMVQINIRDAL